MKTLALITSFGQVSAPLPPQELDLAALRQGLSDNAFVAFYQPQLSLKTGTIAGLEVLARWNHPEKGLLTPGHFLEAIERFDLLDELFLRLFEQGLVLRKKLESVNLPVTMSFNLHPSQLSNPMLNKAINVLLRTHQCRADAVTLEITETGTLNLSDVVMDNLLQLRQMGCGVSLDDFGTGFSSLERLCDLPFSELKLDAIFVRRLDTHPACATIVTHAIGLASALGLSLVVEGVESQRQLKQLSAMGCSIVQGYAIAAPMADDALQCFMLKPATSARVALKSV